MKIESIEQEVTGKGWGMPAGPEGILPLHLWREQRKEDIEAAIIRYVLAAKNIPPEWVSELESLNGWLKIMEE